MVSCSSLSVIASLLTTATTRSATPSSCSGGRMRTSPGIGMARGHEPGGRREGDQRAALAGLDLLDVQGAGGHADADDVEQAPRGLRQRAEAIDELGADVLHLGVVGGAGQPLVERESLIDLGDIVFGDEAFLRDADHGLDARGGRFAAQFSHGFRKKLGVKIVTRGGGSAAKFAHGSRKKLGVKIVPGGGDMAVLLGPEGFAGAADLEVAQGQLNPQPKFGQLLQPAHIAAVGYDLYAKLLAEAVRE